jgi:DNA (cytosine-5)-methyltransferase 1
MTNCNSPFSYVDLFAGIGGFKIALDRNGGKSVGFSEINNDAISFYCQNFKERESNNFGDITKIENLPKHDLLTAGVPCQSWSIAGKNLGFEDSRGQLWNDTIYLLKKSQPKTFIFENVKGLVDPRNKEALSFILNGIKEAGYFVNYHIINAHDYDVPQNRIRVYIIGFKNEDHFKRFQVPQSVQKKHSLAQILKLDNLNKIEIKAEIISADKQPTKSMSLSSKNGFNEYFLFNDLRNGHTTVHSWDIFDTTTRQKDICYLLLKNRRKKAYGLLDGNPLSLKHFKMLDPSICIEEINELIDLNIIKAEEYTFTLTSVKEHELSENELILLSYNKMNQIQVDVLKTSSELKTKNISIQKTISGLKEKGAIECTEMRYTFKNGKISTGLFGINRIFLPTSDIFPTLVASDSNDYIALKNLVPINHKSYKDDFVEYIYNQNLYRKITQKEACLIQGFPEDFILPESRSRWIKLIGNSVSVPVIDILCKAIIETGVFEANNNLK